MGLRKVITHHSHTDPLALIPREDWPKVISDKSRFVSTALNVDLEYALKILDELEEVKAWEYFDLSREEFLQFKCKIHPDKLPKIRKGFKIMRDDGLNPRSVDDVDKFLDDLDPLPENGQIGRGRNSFDNVKAIPTKGGNSAKYLLRRLNSRGHRDLARRVVIGELSAYAAAKEAGFIKKPSPLDVCRSAWSKMTQADRETFLREINAKT
jgi:hypothetical protein